MNIDQALSYVSNKGTLEIKAGGPGSGRKPEWVLIQKIKHFSIEHTKS